MNENLIHFFRQRGEVFPFQNDIDIRRFIEDSIGRPLASFPIPARIYLEDELKPYGYGFPLVRSPILDDLAARAEKWIADEIAALAADASSRRAADDSLQTYRAALIKVARNAVQSSILADYHAAFWLVHSQQLARVFAAIGRRPAASSAGLTREQTDLLKYRVHANWAQRIRDSIPEFLARSPGTGAGSGTDERNAQFIQLVLENPLIVTEETISSDLRELASYFAGQLRRDMVPFKKWVDSLSAKTAELMSKDKVFRRAVTLLGYPETPPTFITVLDRRVQQLLGDHPSTKPVPDQALFETISKRLLECVIVQQLRKGVVWLSTNSAGEHVSEDGRITYSRATRPMNFGRRGVVEPIVYRFGLVYDITSFAQTLGDIARSGKEEEQTAYRQLLEFQRDLAEIARRHGLQFEKFLGDGAFYTARHATRAIHAAVEIQTFYAKTRTRGFSFNKGMRLALNYGYYRLLPMQVSADGTAIMEFYGPGIVELSRLTTGKATKEIEDIQHLLLSHGYDQAEVYRFFAPLSRGADRPDPSLPPREFYAYVNASGHLVNEGIVVSIPFLKQVSTELLEERQKIYRLRSAWGTYLGFTAMDHGSYIGIRLLGSAALKGIGSVEVAEVERFASADVEISVVEEERPFLQLLETERNVSAASVLAAGDVSIAALVVCQSQVVSGNGAVILVGEWDPVSKEVRRPIRIDQNDAERFGLMTPLSVENVESQSRAYQNLYQNLSRLETLPNFSVDAIRENVNFNGFIIGETVERL